VTASDDLAATAAVYAMFIAENGIGFDLVFAAELRGRGDEALMEAGRAVMEPPLRAAPAITGGNAKAAPGWLPPKETPRPRRTMWPGKTRRDAEKAGGSRPFLLLST
jgi:hypothetical protein